jgi:Icc protein
MRDVLDDAPFQVNGTYRAGGWSLVMLNSYARNRVAGRLDDAELVRLQTELSAPDERHTLVCLHHHPVPMGSRWLDGVALDNADELLAIVDRAPRVRGLLWGHVHQASDRRRGHLRLISTPSTCTQFLPGSDDFALDTRPPAYRRLTLQPDGNIDTDIVWLE